jgi:ATP-dependent DNA ligase
MAIERSGSRARAAFGSYPARERFRVLVPVHGKSTLESADDTVVDGEIVALDETGRPSFNGSKTSTPCNFYAFDLASRRNLGDLALQERRELPAPK